jgi:uncharacterized protein (TIGR02231 family)
MRVILGCLAGLMASGAWADEFSVQSTVSDALVTPTGGIITRAVPVDLPAGVHEITILGAPDLDSEAGNAINFPDGSGLTMIAGSGTYAIAQEPVYQNTDQYRTMKQAVDAARNQLHAHQKLESAQQAIVQAAEVRLTFVKQFANGGSSVLSLEQLTDPNLISNLASQLGEQAAKAVSDSQEAIRKMMQLGERGNELGKILSRAEERLDEIVPEDRDTLVLKLSVHAAEPFTGEIDLKYLSGEVMWAMISDVVLTQDKAKGALQISQKAIVQQGTGEDWSNVKVTLSTVNLGREAGVNIPREYIRKLYDPAKRSSKRSITAKPSYSSDALAGSFEPMIEEAAAMQFGNSSVIAGQTQVFEINAPLDIQSGEDITVVPLQEIEMDVDLYARARNSEASGFLYADITNETGGRILSSTASLYRDGQYFGEFDMPEIVAGDEYPLQLGVLDGLRVEHSVIKREDGDRGLLSSSQIAESRFKTVVSSLLDYDIPVRLYDRIPVSESEDLIVKEYAKPKISERDIDGRRGVVSWNWDMKAGSEQIVEFGYDLSWPSGFAVE